MSFRPSPNVVPSLAHATTRVEALRALADILHFPYAESDAPVEWVPRRRTGQDRYAEIAPAERAFLTEWATEIVAQWCQVWHASEVASPERHAIWGDPRLIPALHLVDRFLSHANVSPQAAASPEFVRVAAIRGQVMNTGMALVYQSWITYGTLTPPEVHGVLDRWASGDVLPSFDTWTGFGGQPAVTNADLARMFAGGSMLSFSLLDRPGLVDDRVVRDKLWDFNAMHPLLGMLIAAMPPGEFAERISACSLRGDEDGYILLGEMLEQGRPDQIASVRVSTAELARWSEGLPTDLRPALMKIVGQVTTVKGRGAQAR